jgi:hypothetical protein
MSRASDSSETVSVTGSSEATMSVSVLSVARPTPESRPIRSTLVRAARGVGEAAGDALAPAFETGLAADPGAGVGVAGFHAPLPAVDGAKTTFTSSRATFVA